MNKFDIEPGSSVITNPRIRGVLDTDSAKCENPIILVTMIPACVHDPTYIICRGVS